MQSFMDQFRAFAANERDTYITGANNGLDDDIPAEDRPNRPLVAPGCLLKHGDEVEVGGGVALVVCPGRGIGWFYALTFDGQAISIGQQEAQYVTDRIPADPNETPMPIFTE